MIASETRLLMRTILAGWPAQRTRLDEDDIVAMGVVYHAGLADLDYRVCDAAVTRMVRTSTFIPSVAEIRAAAGVIMHGDVTTGAEAWGAVVKAMKEKGSHRVPGVDFFFRDPITERVVRALNWSELCGGEAEKNASDRARFIDAYNNISTRERTTAAATSGGQNPMLEERQAPPLHSLPPPAPMLTAEARSETLRLVLEEAQRRLGSDEVRVHESAWPSDETPCGCTQYHGIDEYNRCLLCRRLDGEKRGSFVQLRADVRG